MQNKLTEMFNTTNKFLKDIYEKKNDNENNIGKIRDLINKIMSLIFILAIVYFLFNLIFSKDNRKYKRTFKSRRRR